MGTTSLFDMRRNAGVNAHGGSLGVLRLSVHSNLLSNKNIQRIAVRVNALIEIYINLNVKLMLEIELSLLRGSSTSPLPALPSHLPRCRLGGRLGPTQVAGGVVVR